MPELERQLAALGEAIAVPPTPDLVAAVRPRLDDRPARSQRPLVLVFALVVLAVAVALAVPPARTALLRFFHIRGATVELVRVLPAAPRQVAADLGRLVPRAQAERDVQIHLLLPPGAHPARVYELDGEVATIPLRRGDRRLLLFEFRSNSVLALKKLVPSSTYVAEARVGGDDGLWVEGGEHVLIWLDRIGRFQSKPARVTGNTLVWVHGNVTLRLQGDMSKRDALAVAKTIR